MSLVSAYAPWSVSKAALAQKCPKAFRFRYVDQLPSVSGTEARVGTVVHRSLELQLQGTPPDQAETQAIGESSDLTSVEAEKVRTFYEACTSYVKRIETFKAKYPIAREFHEVRWAIGADGGPADYNDPKALMRGAVDHALMTDDRHKTVYIIDHKTGRRKHMDEFGRQLDTYAVFAVSNTETGAVKPGIHFVKDAQLEWATLRARDYTVKVLRPWLANYLAAVANSRGDFQPKPQVLCGWCDYLPRCEEGTAFVAERELFKKSKRKKTTT